jgi:hypothetical protein
MRPPRAALPPLCLAALLAAALGACGDDDAGPTDAGPTDAGRDAGPPRTLPPRGSLVLAPREGGRLDVLDSEGTTYVLGATAEAIVLTGPAEWTSVSTADCPGWTWSAAGATARVPPSLAVAEGYSLTCEASIGLRLDWRVLPVDGGGALALLDVTNVSGAPLTVLRTTPLSVDSAEGGALFVGVDPARHRLLDNGADVLRDSEAHLERLDARRTVITATLPITPRGDVIANSSHAIASLDGERTWIAGFLESEHAFPTIGTTYGAARAPIDPLGGRTGLVSLHADALLLFHGKTLAPGTSLPSEALYFDPLATDVWSGLERLGSTIAAWHTISLWTHRADVRRVPVLWNSWSGGGGTGGLGQAIDETIVGGCLDVAARDLRPFGFDTFPVDDGYQPADGDWEGSPANFPAGMAAFNARVAAAGMTPGEWIKLFVVDRTSALAAAHPSWLLEDWDRAIDLITAGDGKTLLDLSNPEVLAWIRATMTRYRDELGAGFLKLDFAYLAMPYVPRADASLTSIEAYVGALRAVREGLGPDVFQVGIGLLPLSYGIADSFRTTYDNGPTWTEANPEALIGASGTFQGTVRTAARRWWLGGRVYVNSDDSLHFRNAITDDEARTLASFMALAGSTIDVGEDLRTLDDVDVETLRHVMPVYGDGTAARPLDVLTREYPELYARSVDSGADGVGTAWTLLGLLHWGRNFDHSGIPSRELPDTARELSIDLGTLGLAAGSYHAYEHWTGAYLGTFEVRAAGTPSDVLRRTLAPHRGEVIALRPALGHPQLLGTNRHITGGATDLRAQRWDAATQTLELTFDVDAGDATARPFAYDVAIYVPLAMTVTAGSAAPLGTLSREGEVLHWRFLPTAPGPLTLRVAFE